MFKETENLIQELLNKEIVCGADYTFIEHGRLVKSVTTGFQQTFPKVERLKENQYFDLASLTKVIGIVPLILKLQEQGRLTVDDLVKDYLPAIMDKRITIRHLLTHTSGATAWIDRRDELNAEELRKAIYHNLSFGADFEQKVVYNDYNYLLLGFIIEQIMHIPVQVAIQREVLKPMRLFQSIFRPNPFETVPTEVRHDLVLRGRVHDPKASSLGLHAGSAGLFATKRDVVSFTLQMLANQNAVLSKATLASLDLNQAPNSRLDRSYGWAFVNRENYPHLLRHSGFTGTFILMNRLTRNGLVFLSNRVHPQPNLEFLDYRQKIYQTFAQEDI